MVNRRCAFPGCRNFAPGPSNLSFFLVHSTRHKQRDMDRWREACDVMEFCPSAVICEEHFELEDFVNPCYKTQGLRPTAVPTRSPRCRQAPTFEVVDVTKTSEVDRPITVDSSKPAERPVEAISNCPSKDYLGRPSKVKVDMTRQIKIKKFMEESLARSAKNSEDTVMEPPKKPKITSLRNIGCRLCLMTKVPGVSAFSPFAGESSLSHIIETCFGIRIERNDFCTVICGECLVKVDLFWKMYSEFQANRLAIEELRRSLKDKKEDAEQHFQDVPDSVEHRPAKKRKTKDKPVPDSSDSDSYSIPEHPFFKTQCKKVYHCHLCPKQLKNETLLKYHLTYKHRDSDPMRLCEYCAKFFHKHKLSQHLQHHFEQKKINCPTCGKVIANERNLQRHMLVHSNVRPFQCKLCDRSFSQSSNLKFHVQRDHPSEENRPNPSTKAASTKPQPPLACPACGQQFKRGRELIKHVESTHPGHPMDIFVCEICSERFSEVLLLRSHRLIYHSGQKFECGRCGLVFKSDGQLRTHRKKHERGV